VTGPRPATRRRALAIGLGLVIAVGMVQAWLGTIAPVLDGALRYGFPAYLTSSRLAVDGGWGPDVYDNDWFHARSLEVTGGPVAEIYRPNTPIMSLLAVPIAGLDVDAARTVWLVVDLLLVALTVVAVLATLPALRAPPWSLLVVALAVWWMPIRETVSLGQAYALMLALQAVALWAGLRGRWVGAGVTLGVAAAAKLAAPPVLLLLAVRGAWRAVGAAIAVGIGLAVVTLPFAGTAGWMRFVQVLVEDVVAPPPSLAVPAYQSLTGLAHRLFVADPDWNPSPLVEAPWLASLIALVASIAVLGVTCWLGRRGRLDVAFGAAAAAGVLVLNLTQQYHLAMLWLPAVIAVARVAEDPRRRSFTWVLVLVVSTVFIAAPWPAPDLRLSGWSLLPLAYLRLIGAWLLWAWLVADLCDRSVAERVEQVGGRLDRVGAHG
jgi:hypothetical protein